MKGKRQYCSIYGYIELFIIPVNIHKPVQGFSHDFLTIFHFCGTVFFFLIVNKHEYNQIVFIFQHLCYGHTDTYAQQKNISICLKIKHNSVRIRFLRSQFCVLPRIEPAPLIHCNTKQLAVCPAPYTTRSTENTMAKRKRIKRQTMIQKTLHRKQNFKLRQPLHKNGNNIRCSGRVLRTYPSTRTEITSGAPGTPPQEGE